jgi:hypothetical protein
VATDHFQNHPKWDPAITSITKTSPGPMGPGTSPTTRQAAAMLPILLLAAVRNKLAESLSDRNAEPLLSMAERRHAALAAPPDDHLSYYWGNQMG